MDVEREQWYVAGCGGGEQPSLKESGGGQCLPSPLDSVETLSSNQKAQIQVRKVTRVKGGAGGWGETFDSPRGSRCCF